MDAAGRFVDHVGVGVREQLAQQRRFLTGERQGGEGRFGAGGGLGLGDEALSSLRAGQPRDESVPQPRKAHLRFGILKEGLERDLAAELAQGDAGLGADAQVLLSELRRNLVGDRWVRFGFAQDLHGLDADLGVGVIQQGQGRRDVGHLAVAHSHPVAPDRMDAGEAGGGGIEGEREHLLPCAETV